MAQTSFDFVAFGAAIGDQVRQGLATARDAAGIAAVMAAVAARVEEALVRAITPAEREIMACGPGCAACCVVSVTVLAPEAAAIAEHLRTTLESGDLALLARRIAETAAKVRWMEEGERIRRQIPCPFLDLRGWCVIHPVRPLTCRALTSTDADQCRRALDSRSHDDEEPLMVNIFQKFLVETAFREAAAALDARGLDSRGMELAGAVFLFLAGPDRAAGFLAGASLRSDDGA